MAGADSMHSCEKKKLKIHHIWRKSMNFPCDGLLESPLNIHPPRKFWKIQLQTKIEVARSKSMNSIHGFTVL
jgi:hypothetical protein